MRKVLVVQPSPFLAKSLLHWLSEEYEIRLVTTGYQALGELATNNYAAILLDLNLSDIGGCEVCIEIRHKGIKTPILVLTSTSKVSIKVNMLDAGADDYLLKPFYVSELKARLRALIRRSDSIEASILRAGDLTLDPASRRVERAGKQINLRRKEFDILEYLIRNRGTVVTRNMIIANSWDSGADRWDNNVDVHIKYLRDKIDRSFSTKLIKTAYGVGYIIDNPR